jgi:hypothetical protein
LRIQSVVGLTSLFAISIMEKNVFKALPDFNKRVKWFESYRKKNGKFLPNEEHAQDDTLLMSLVPKDKLVALLQRMLNESEFLSPGGIRALSKHHEKNPYTVNIEGTDYRIQYDPGDSTSDFFGGNSNWRGPVWLPINYLLIQSIKELGSFYGDSLQLEYPSGSGIKMNLAEIGDALSARVISLFEKDETGHRRYNEAYKWFYTRPENQDLLLYFEYFHGDSGKGLGASHQTGWTALVANLVSQLRRQDAGVD